MRDFLADFRPAAAPVWFWAGNAAVLLLAVIGLEWAAPAPRFRPLPPLALPSQTAAAQSATDLAAGARDVALARPLFATSRRPLPVAGGAGGSSATADRISGVIVTTDAFGAEIATAIMTPKDGGKPVTLRVGDKFRGKSIVAIDASGLTFGDGSVVRPQFSATEPQIPPVKTASPAATESAYPAPVPGFYRPRGSHLWRPGFVPPMGEPR